MKRLLMLAAGIMISIVSIAQNTNNLYWSMTVNVKMDKRLEWEKKIVLFVKAHYPQLKYRIWEIQSGENTGSYSVVMGPMSFKDMDVPMVSPKGEAVMKTDGQALDALCNSTQVGYARKQEDVSRMKADRKLKYTVFTFNEINVGTWDDVHGILMKRKESRAKGGSMLDIDYFRPTVSGNNNAFTSVRYFEKLEELDVQENLGEMYDKMYGNNASYIDGVKYSAVIKATRSELRMLRADLSSL